MKKSVPAIALSVALTLLLCPLVLAVPVEMNYQGYVTDSGGAPISGAKNVTFRLYDGLNAVQWNSGSVAVDVTNGVYSVTLGASPQPAINPAIFSQDLWLGIAVGSDPEMIPRQKLTSVAFAIRTASAERADSVTDGGVTNVMITGPIAASKIEQGPGSGLNADLLDGLNSTSFASSGHAHGFGEISGTLQSSQLSGTYTSPLTLSSALNVLSGNGSGLTSLHASNLTTGFVANGRLASSYSQAISFSNIPSATVTTFNAGEATLTGNLTLPSTAAAAGIIRSGSNTLMHTYGTSNFFAGVNAGNLTMTGTGNTGGGNYTLNKNSSGGSNTATGFFALTNNTSGSSNTAVGYLTLLGNTTAGKNTAVGLSALGLQSFNNGGATWDSENTAVGFEALYANQPVDTGSGVYNAAVGSQALRNNSTGDSNTAAGAYAMTENSTGRLNTAVGASALRNNKTGDYNVSMGALSLFSNTTSSNNTAVGMSALRLLSFDNSNVPYESRNTAIGAYALYSTQPVSTATGANNSSVGWRALYLNNSGFLNVALGAEAGAANTTGYQNTFIGALADAASMGLFNSAAIGYNAVVDASNRVRIGNGSVNQIGGAVAWSNLSDIRQKKDIQEIGYGLDLVMALKPVEFRLKDGNDRIDFGFIAQDIEALVGDEYNILGVGGDPDRTLSLRYTDFIAPLVKAVQEQQVQIEEQKALIDALRAEIDEIKNRLTY